MKLLPMCVASLAIAALNGCAAFYQPSAIASIDCTGQRCDQMWARAQTWLVTNGRYRIQTMNDNVIQTFGPHEGVYDAVAYTLTREKGASGSTVIRIIGTCKGTVYGCVFDPAPHTNLLYQELSKL